MYGVTENVRALTSEAAWQLGSEHEVGSLEAGKLADMVILERAPRKVAPKTIKDLNVLETWMDEIQVFKSLWILRRWRAALHTQKALSASSTVH